MKRTATAEWRGNLKQGLGAISTESGAIFKIPYSFAKRFSDERGTNPEELIGAAHSGCFAMAMSLELEKRKLKAESINVEAQVTLDKVANDWAVTEIHLNVSAEVPGATDGEIQQAADAAKTNCPISRLLRAHITMNLNLPSQAAEVQL